MSHMVSKNTRCHVHRDVDEFHEVANEAHDSEANGDCPANVQVLWSQESVRNSLDFPPTTPHLFVWALCIVSRTGNHGM